MVLIEMVLLLVKAIGVTILIWAVLLRWYYNLIIIEIGVIKNIELSRTPGHMNKLVL